MDTQQTLTLLKSWKKTIDDRSESLGIAIGVLENTLHTQSVELEETYKAKIDEKTETIEALNDEKEILLDRIDELESEPEETPQEEGQQG